MHCIEPVVEFLSVVSILNLESIVGSTSATQFFKRMRASEVIYRLLLAYWKLSPLKNYHRGAGAARRIVRYTSYASMLAYLTSHGSVDGKSIAWDYFETFRDLPPLEEV